MRQLLPPPPKKDPKDGTEALLPPHPNRDAPQNSNPPVEPSQQNGARLREVAIKAATGDPTAIAVMEQYKQKQAIGQPRLGDSIPSFEETEKERKIAYETGGVALPDFKKKEAAKKRDVEASLISEFMPQPQSDVNTLNKAFKIANTVGEGAQLQSDIDLANDEVVGSYLQYLGNKGDSDKQSELASMWSELKSQKESGDLNTSQMKQYRNLVTTAYEKSNAPVKAQIRDLKSKFDIDTFYAQAEMADTPEEMAALRRKTGVTEEVENEFRNLRGSIRDTGLAYDMVTKQFKELSDEEADNKSAEDQRARLVRAIEATDNPALKAVAGAHEAVVGFGKTVIDLGAGILKALL